MTQRQRAGLDRRSQLHLIGLIFLFGGVLLAFELGRTPEVPEAAVVAAEPLDFQVRGPVALAAGEFISPPDEEEAGDPLAGIEDNTLGLSRREFEAASRILKDLAMTDAEEMQRLARTDASFTVLMQQPDLYRGKVVRLVGDLRRLTPFPSLARYDGPDETVEGWLFTLESGTNPYRIIALDAAPSIDTGESIEPTPVIVDGVFFKRFGYATATSSHVAPMLLAKSIRLKPQAVAPPNDNSLTPLILIAAAVLMGLLVVAVRRKEQRRDVRFRINDGSRVPLEDIESEDPGEFLERLSVETGQSDDATA